MKKFCFEDGTKEPFLSPILGIVTNVYIQPGDILVYGWIFNFNSFEKKEKENFILDRSFWNMRNVHIVWS